MADARAELLQALTERDPALRRRLLLAVTAAPPKALDDDTIALIVGALHDGSDLNARTAALDVLGAIGSLALPALLRLLDDPSPGVRRLAVDAAGYSPTTSALPLLERAAGDENATVRAAALEGIARLGGPEAIAILEKQLEPGAPSSAVLAALLGLEQLNAPPKAALVRPWLADALTAGAALRLLGRAGDLESLVNALGGSSRIRARSALLGLQEGLERGTAVPPTLAGRSELILGMISTGDAAVASAAAIVLAHLGRSAGIVKALERDDATILLPGLHRSVKHLEQAKGFRIDDLRRDLGAVTAGAEVARELVDAAVRRHAFIGRGNPRSVSSELDEQTFQALASWFAAAAGLQIGSDARSRVEARLLPRLQARGINSFEGYLSILRGDDDQEILSAIEAITVHETYFFRETASLNALRDEVGPTLAVSRRTLDVWSAGCSTGEEPYTLSIILGDLMGAGIIDSYSVLGTDISARSVAAGVVARYGRRSFRGELDAREKQHFILDDEGGGTPKKYVRTPVELKVLNLVDDKGMSSLPHFDVIFCRNVLIYLTPEARRQVLQAFHDRLRPGGILLLGHSESLLHVENPFELWPMRRGLAYRRSLT